MVFHEVAEQITQDNASKQKICIPERISCGQKRIPCRQKICIPD